MIIRIENQPRDKPKRHRGFTDRMYLFNVCTVTAITAVALLHTTMTGWRSMDLSVYAYLIPAAWGELAIHTALIVWKAKRENERKFPVNTGATVKGGAHENQLEAEADQP